MRRLAWTSFAALALMLATAVPSAFANGVAQNAKFRATLADLPSTVHAGQTMKGVIGLANLTTLRQHADIQFAIVTPLGNALVRQSPHDIAPSYSKTVRSSFTVSEDAKPGQYELVITISSNDVAPLVLRHPFAVD